MRNSGRRSNGSSVRNGVMCKRGRRSGRPRRRRTRAAEGRRGFFPGREILRATESYVLLRSSPQQGLFCKGIVPQNLVPQLRCRPTLCSATGALNKTLLRDLVAAKFCQTDQKEYRTMFLAPQPSCCATPCSAKFARQLRCSAEPCSETGALRRTLPGDRVA